MYKYNTITLQYLIHFRKKIMKYNASPSSNRRSSDLRSNQVLRPQYKAEDSKQAQRKQYQDFELISQPSYKSSTASIKCKNENAASPFKNQKA